ncbi:hypothetical protein BHE74_00022527 [Ensete ventricosum]|nr:hypothetical protein GW17_00016576 [Ensete ventricosum]RWW69843.1 hypothetical protein BHE74_00022527 [Ensete ventricosum]RZS25905.1 hypothetical protein BHM03_00059169 [Ensete ventricosum]
MIQTWCVYCAPVLKSVRCREMYSFARTLEKVLLFLQRWMEGQACDKAECRTAEIVAVIHGASRFPASSSRMEMGGGEKMERIRVSFTPGARKGSPTSIRSI